MSDKPDFIFLYTSSYWCEECSINHPVSVWFSDDKYIVIDDDGDVVQKFYSYKLVVEKFPEDNRLVAPITKNKKIVKWHMLVNNDLTVQSLLESKNPFLKKNKIYWISPEKAPEIVKITLGLNENNRISEEIKTWKDLEVAIKNINGEQRKYKNALTTIFSFDVEVYD